MTPPPRPLAPHVAAALAAAQAKPSPRSRPAAPAPHVQAALGACAQARMPVPTGPRPPAPHVQAALSGRTAAPARPTSAPIVPQALVSAPPTPIVQPYRHPAGVVQRATFNYATVDMEDPSTYSSPAFDWEEYGAYLRDLDKLKSEQSKPIVIIKPRTTKKLSQKHLEEFAKKTNQITDKTPANQVLTLGSATGGGALKPNAKQDVELEAAITRPDESDEVDDTTEDGEVVPLIGYLKAFKAYLVKNADKDLNFTLAFSGSHGACDGCKKRIDAFVDLWIQAADAAMEKGKTAKLKITYRYLVPAKDFPRTWGVNTYGWEEDGYDSPLFHTIQATVRG
jgi:hypothetical protein